MRRARRGDSWSGHERNVCYLNTTDGAFVDVSRLTGLDLPDDGRALSVVDWDHDGDLDLWCRNRTAPRLRLLLNRRGNRGRQFVALRLRGTKSNRDGIGAVVEVRCDSDANAPGKRLVRSLRAGDLFLSQSSRWLHFGLGEEGREISSVEVLWPGGRREQFRGVATNGRYLLEEGRGKAEPWQRTTRAETTELRTTPAPTVTHAGTPRRIILPRAVPFPRLAYAEASSPDRTAAAGDAADVKARLLLVGSSECLHCRGELQMLSEQAAAFRDAGFDVLGLMVGATDDSARRAAADAVAATRFPFAWGFLDDASWRRIEVFQSALFDRTPSATVPLAFLLNADNQALAIYRGRTAATTILDDARRLPAASPVELHHWAPPYPGTWFTHPVDDAAMAEFLARQFQEHLPADAIAYLELAHASTATEQRERLRAELVSRHVALARVNRDGNLPAAAAEHFTAALRYAPESAALHYEYGVFLGTHGQLDDAEREFRRVLLLEPRSKAARESLRRIQEEQRARR